LCDVAAAVAADLGRWPRQSWGFVLKRYVDDRGRIDFEGLAGDPEPLRRVVAFIGATNAGWTPGNDADHAETLAFFINAYNALAMHSVLEPGTVPAESRDFFMQNKQLVGGQHRSLYDFENGVIRRLNEPRVHFALNWMSRSCPRLPQVPFEAAELDRQLDEAARAFVNDPGRVTVDHEQREVTLSPILQWYHKDFLAEAPTLVAYVNRYRDEPVPADYRVRYHEFNWTLNAVGRP
jgi:hypothetical protein